MTNYKVIDGFSGYRIGDDVSVWSCWRRRKTAAGHYETYRSNKWTRLRGFINGKRAGTKDRGRRSYALKSDETLRLMQIQESVLMATAFIGPRPEGYYLRHLNGDALDNRISNLAYGTPSQNVADAIKHGTCTCGEGRYNAKLTVEQAAEIKRRAMSGEDYKSIAADFGVESHLPGKIKRGKLWRRALEEAGAKVGSR